MPSTDRGMDIRDTPGSPSVTLPSKSSVPIIDVHGENFHSLWPSILLAIKSSTFVALDTELSGLGDRRSMMANSIEDRYKAITMAARSRSILSLGLSCFKLKPQQQELFSSTSDAKVNDSQEEKPVSWNYMVQTFNITVLCHDDYTVEPRSLQFLVDHGFDFNKQYSKGSLYYRGNDRKHSEVHRPSVRDLFTELLMANVPVVFHNAIVDLIFLHQNFYCDLPFKLNSFLCNLSEMFAAGIYDTKFIIEYYMRMPASYLEYVFKKCLRQTVKRCSPKRTLLLSFLDYPPNFLYLNFHDFYYERQPNPKTYSQLKDFVCQRFADHGWCSKGRNCPKSHNMDLVLDLHELKPSKTQRRKDRKRKLEEEEQQVASNVNAKMCRTTIDGIKDLSAEQSNPNGESKDQSVNDDQQESGPIISVYYDDDDDDNNSKDSSVISEDVGSPSVEDNPETIKTPSTDSGIGTQQNMTRSVNAGHTAGFDSFMTGYIFATAIAHKSNVRVNEELKISGGQLPMWRNKVYLTSKEVPLSVAKSSFASVSNFHKEKHKRSQERTKV